MMYFYLGNSDYVYIALNKHSRILVYALIFENPKYMGNYHYGHRISIKNQNKKPCNKPKKPSGNLVTRFEVGS